MRELLPPILLVVLVLAVPIVPFLWFGPPFEAQIRAWLDQSLPPATMAALVVGILATDIFLPIPSSFVSTLAGSALGFVPATAASWTGMTLGAAAAFGLARWLGRPAALWFSGREDLDRMDVLSRRYGPMILVLARPVPVLAEASVLLLGTTRLGWRWFLLPVALANLGIAAAYSALGTWVAMPVAMAASVALPLLAAAISRKVWPGDLRSRE
jgi:uncharacterized membrane protein YdjX (TVP38/TMEM64 family)